VWSVIEQGKITQVVLGNPSLEADQVVDLGGLALLPGVVDSHAHFNEPGREHWEGYQNGTMAAAAGGVTTIFDMPNNNPFISTVEAFKQKLEIIKSKAYVDYGIVAAIVGLGLYQYTKLPVDAFPGYIARHGAGLC
jgi:dihydroorotase-like cyclic amidohydrolase